MSSIKQTRQKLTERTVPMFILSSVQDAAKTFTVAAMLVSTAHNSVRAADCWGLMPHSVAEAMGKAQIILDEKTFRAITGMLIGPNHQLSLIRGMLQKHFANLPTDSAEAKATGNVIESILAVQHSVAYETALCEQQAAENYMRNNPPSVGTGEQLQAARTGTVNRDTGYAMAVPVITKTDGKTVVAMSDEYWRSGSGR